MNETVGKDGVWLPLSLAIPMMECYFGGGPRRTELRPQLEGDSEMGSAAEDPGHLVAVEAVQKMVPRGFAARKYGVKHGAGHHETPEGEEIAGADAGPAG